MSSDERDAAVWEAVGGDPEELAVNGADADGSTEYVPMDVFEEFRRDVIRRLEALENGEPPDDTPDVPLFNYLQMTQEHREENLSTSERISLVIHENWRDIAWGLGGGRTIHGDSVQTKHGVDTKAKANAKHNPGRLKHRLKQLLDWEPQSVQIYRALRRLAKLSGGEEKVDASTNRVHISGGLYEYREKATADGKDTRRVLWRADDD